jgi:bifunctional DNA-binding transcriptional regulator/antitoxin component of YhaV-PrlF toxin-antitoxin module
MTAVGVRTWQVALDAKRRPTLPAALLEEAGISPADALVAHADGEGVIVLETRAAVRRRLQQRYADGRRRAGRTGSAAEELIAERAADHSLRR